MTIADSDRKELEVIAAAGDAAGPRCANRVFEWAMAFAFLGFGAHSIWLPETLSSSRYAGVLLILTSMQFAFALFILGVVRIGLLFSNGHLGQFGIYGRAMASGISAVFLLQLGFALAQTAPGGYPSPGMWVYFALTGAELRSVWRARREANNGKIS